MSNTDFLGRAIDVVKKAIEQDTAGEYDKAYQLYYQARTLQLFHLTRCNDTDSRLVELFMLALKCTRPPGASVSSYPLISCAGEKNAKSKEMIRAKAAEYMERAEKLKNHLADQDTDRKKPSAMGANGKASNGAPKGK
jgi:vacuolar protein-sorting-associated protein 4